MHKHTHTRNTNGKQPPQLYRGDPLCHSLIQYNKGGGGGGVGGLQTPQLYRGDPLLKALSVEEAPAWVEEILWVTLVQTDPTVAIISRLLLSISMTAGRQLVGC